MCISAQISVHIYTGCRKYVPIDQRLNFRAHRGYKTLHTFFETERYFDKHYDKKNKGWICASEGGKVKLINKNYIDKGKT